LGPRTRNESTRGTDAVRPLEPHELGHERLERDARLEPRERRAETEVLPKPKPGNPDALRSTSRRSGSGNWRSSRFAEPRNTANVAALRDRDASDLGVARRGAKPICAGVS
jgi:hypothetical protein